MIALSAVRAFLFATVAWIGGLALAVAVGFALGLSLPGPAGIVGGGLVLGAIVGATQRRVMGVPGARLVLVTALAAPVAFLASAFLAAQLEAPGLTSLTGPLVLLLQLLLTRRVAYSPQMSGGSLRGAVLGWGAAIGWGIAIGGLVVPGMHVGVRVVGLAVPGMMAATYAALRSSSFSFSPHFASAQHRNPVE